MKAKELAEILLQNPDDIVTFTYYAGGPDYLGIVMDTKHMIAGEKWDESRAEGGELTGDGVLKTNIILLNAE